MNPFLQAIWDVMSSDDGNAFAGWGGLILSVASLVIAIMTYFAASASKLAAERALAAVKNIDVLQTLSDSLGILEHINDLHNNKGDARVISVHYSYVCRLLNAITPVQSLLNDEEKASVKTVVLHAKLAQEEYGKLIREKTYDLDYAQLVSNLLNDLETLGNTAGMVRDRIGEEYVGRQSNASQ